MGRGGDAIVTGQAGRRSLDSSRLIAMAGLGFPPRFATCSPFSRPAVTGLAVHQQWILLLLSGRFFPLVVSNALIGVVSWSANNDLMPSDDTPA